MKKGPHSVLFLILEPPENEREMEEWQIKGFMS
jgi:hypothetical protein